MFSISSQSMADGDGARFYLQSWLIECYIFVSVRFVMRIRCHCIDLNHQTSSTIIDHLPRTMNPAHHTPDPSFATKTCLHILLNDGNFSPPTSRAGSHRCCPHRHLHLISQYYIDSTLPTSSTISMKENAELETNLRDLRLTKMARHACF